MSASTKLADHVLMLLDRGLRLSYVKLIVQADFMDKLRASLTETTPPDIAKTAFVNAALTWRAAAQQINATRGAVVFDEDLIHETLLHAFPRVYVEALAESAHNKLGEIIVADIPK